MAAIHQLNSQARDRLRRDHRHADAARSARRGSLRIQDKWRAGPLVFLSCNSWYLGANIPGKPRMFMPLVGGYPLYADKCAAVAPAGYVGFVVS